MNKSQASMTNDPAPMTKRFGHWDLGSRISKSGFTLLEMVVSFGLFAVVFITAIGAVLAINGAYIKASRIQDVQDNLRFALESMTKELRTATGIQPAQPLAMPSAYGEVAFTRSDGVIVAYCAGGSPTNFLKLTGSSANCSTLGLPVTDSSIVIERLVLYVIGEQSGPGDGQPRVTIALGARSADPKLATTFQLQTTLTPRTRDR